MTNSFDLSVCENSLFMTKKITAMFLKVAVAPEEELVIH